MTYVARCHLDPPGLGGTPVRFVRPRSENMDPERWAYAPEGWVTRSSTSAIDASGSAARLWFAAPEVCARRACALVLDADAPADLVASVDNVPAAVERPGSPILRVALPAGVTDTWVTFTRTSGQALGLRIRSIRVVPTESR